MIRIADRRWKGARLTVAGLLLVSQTALAGPPYITDDPIPTDLRHFEIYAYTDNDFSLHATDGEAGFDINYGLAPNTQLTAVVAGGYANGNSGHGLQVADTEVGVKYAFIHDEKHGVHIAFFPTLVLPTAPGGGRIAYELPVWGQKDFGKWSVFGGGGPTIRSGYAAHTSWQQGIALNRRVTDDFSLGIEVAHSSSGATGEYGATTPQIGTSIHLKGPFSLIAAGGPVFEDHTGRKGAHLYAAILSNF